MATKFYARNYIAVLGTAAVLGTLSIALVWMRREALIARNEQRHAESSIQEERKLAHLLLFDYFTQLQEIPGSTPAQRKAADEAIRYLDELTQSSQSAELKLDVVQAYQKMGLLLGSPYVANLGDAPAAIMTLQKATVLSQHLLTLNPQNLDYRVAFMDVQKAMAQAYFAMKQPEKALAVLLPAAEMARSVAKDPQANGKMLNQCGALLKTLADTYGQHANGATQNFDKAVDSLQQAGVMYQASVDRGSQLYTGPVISYLFLGVLLRSVDIDQSIEMFNKALGLIAALPVAEQAKVSMVRLRQTCQEKLGGIYLSLGRKRDADLVLGATRPDFLHAIAVDPIDTRARDDLIAADTTILNATPITNTPATRKLMQEYLETTEWLVRNHPRNNSWQYVHAEALLNFAKLYMDLGDDAAAAPYIARGLPKILSIAKQPDADAETLSLAAEALLFAKRDPVRDPLLAVAFAESAIVSTHPSTPDQLITLAKAQSVAGQHEASRTSILAAEALLKAHPRSYKNALQSAEARRLLKADQ